MGAKLSKKKKGYCLGAGKDGESTETTEVEQKETENQEGQKDAAEPKGEKASTDQSQNNGVNEEKEKKSGTEVTTGETTKEESDQKPEIKPSTEHKVEEKDQPQSKESEEVKTASSEQVCEKENESEDKTKTECEVKETLAVAADKPTQESNPGLEQSRSSESQQMTPVQDEVAVKQVSEPVTKGGAEQNEKAPVGAEDHISEKAAEVSAQANESAVEPEKVPEKVEPSVPESVPVEPVLEKVAETVVSEPVTKTQVVEAVKPAAAKPEVDSIPEKVDSVLPNTEPTSEPVEPASKEPELVPEPVKSALQEAVPEIKLEIVVPEQNVKNQKDPEPVPCPASERISETKQDQEFTQPPKSTEVPDEPDAREHTDNQESFGHSEQGADTATIQPPATETASILQASEILEHATPEAILIQNGPSENSAEDVHVEVHPISTELTVDAKEQKESVEQNGGLDEPLTQQESQVMMADCKAPIDVFVTTKNENDHTTAQDNEETHDESQHCNSEDKIETHNPSAEQVNNENEPPASGNLEKHGVGNGLPIKEEIKVHLENKCDLHDINGQSESHEIQVCNE